MARLRRLALKAPSPVWEFERRWSWSTAAATPWPRLARNPLLVRLLVLSLLRLPRPAILRPLRVSRLQHPCSPACSTPAAPLQPPCSPPAGLLAAPL